MLSLMFCTMQIIFCNTASSMTLGAPDEELNAAVKIYNDRNYRQAFSSFALLAKKRPGDTNVQYYLGLCYFQLGDRARARQQFEWIFDSPADTSLKSRAGEALNQLLGVKPTQIVSASSPRMPKSGMGRGVDSNGVNIGCDIGQNIPGRGKQIYTDYGVYIPTNYSGNEKLPWILALSPSSSSGDWFELLSYACDKHHWGLAASKNSNNQSVWPKIEPVLKDTVESAPSRFPFDPNEFCIAGFSGAAARVHKLAYHWPKVRKIIVSNGCMGEEELKARNYPRGKSAVFIVGSLEPNLKRIKRDQQFLMQRGWKTKWIEFAGGHQFPPEGAFDQAIEWLRNPQ